MSECFGVCVCTRALTHTQAHTETDKERKRIKNIHVPF